MFNIPKTIFEKIELTVWFNMFMFLSLTFFLLIAAGVITIFPAIPTALISLGIFFISYGERLNHSRSLGSVPVAQHLGEIVYTELIAYQRKNTFIGWIFIAIGLIMSAIGVYQLFI